MREPYVPIFCSIIESTLWSADPATCKVYITMLAKADPEGYVASSVDGIAASARLSIGETEIALAELMAPDIRSRTKTNDGRRVFEVDRGWHIPALPVFRKLAREEAEKARKRAWARENNSGRPMGASASARRTETETETETITETEDQDLLGRAEPRSKAKPKNRATALPDSWAPNSGHSSLASELGVSIQLELPKFLDHHAAKGSRFVSWDAALRTWLRNAQSYSRGRQGPANGNPVSRTQESAERVARLRAEEAAAEGRKS